MEIFDTFFNVPVLIRTFPLLMQGLWVTLQIGVVSIVAGLVLGLALALIRLYGPVWTQLLARAYINFMRSIPLLVLLIIIYYALPFVGIRLSPFLSAVSALSLVSAAYTAEIFRAGIEAVPKGQFEASSALGLSYRHMMVDVVLPQAIRRILPALGTQFVYVLKMSSLISVIGYQELTRRANELTLVEYRPLEIYTVLVLEYLVLILIVSWLVRRLEKRMGAGERGH